MTALSWTASARGSSLGDVSTDQKTKESLTWFRERRDTWMKSPRIKIQPLVDPIKEKDTKDSIIEIQNEEYTTSSSLFPDIGMTKELRQMKAITQSQRSASAPVTTIMAGEQHLEASSENSSKMATKQITKTKSISPPSELHSMAVIPTDFHNNDNVTTSVEEKSMFELHNVLHIAGTSSSIPIESINNKHVKKFASKDDCSFSISGSFSSPILAFSNNVDYRNYDNNDSSQVTSNRKSSSSCLFVNPKTRVDRETGFSRNTINAQHSFTTPLKVDVTACSAEASNDSLSTAALPAANMCFMLRNMITEISQQYDSSISSNITDNPAKTPCNNFLELVPDAKETNLSKMALAGATASLTNPNTLNASSQQKHQQNIDNTNTAISSFQVQLEVDPEAAIVAKECPDIAADLSKQQEYQKSKNISNNNATNIALDEMTIDGMETSTFEVTLPATTSSKSNGSENNSGYRDQKIRTFIDSNDNVKIEFGTTVEDIKKTNLSPPDLPRASMFFNDHTISDRLVVSKPKQHDNEEIAVIAVPSTSPFESTKATVSCATTTDFNSVNDSLTAPDQGIPNNKVWNFGCNSKLDTHQQQDPSVSCFSDLPTFSVIKSDSFSSKNAQSKGDDPTSSTLLIGSLSKSKADTVGNSDLEKSSLGADSTLNYKSIGRSLYRDRLIEFYEKYNPSKLESVDKHLKKYEGQEEKLFASLEAKYCSSKNYLVPSGDGPICFLEFISSDGMISGMVTIQLFADKAPMAAENFRCLCTGEKGLGRSGKRLCYIQSHIHRIVANFCVQGGDFTTGDGTGGESIYAPSLPNMTNLWGKFKDETPFLAHDRPGLLCMANDGPNSNGSQFFFTLRASPHLNGKHVVFGIVTKGMDIIEKIGEMKTDSKNRPLETVTISDCGEIIIQRDDEGSDIKSSLTRTILRRASESLAMPKSCFPHKCSEDSKVLVSTTSSTSSILCGNGGMELFGERKSDSSCHFGTSTQFPSFPLSLATPRESDASSITKTSLPTDKNETALNCLDEGFDASKVNSSIHFGMSTCESRIPTGGRPPSTSSSNMFRSSGMLTITNNSNVFGAEGGLLATNTSGVPNPTKSSSPSTARADGGTPTTTASSKFGISSTALSYQVSTSVSDDGAALNSIASLSSFNGSGPPPNTPYV